MANQITVNSGSGNITVTTSRSVIGTVANVASANFANFAGEVVDASQPNITSVGTLSNLNVANTITTLDLVVTGNFAVGNLVANSANFANFAGVANVANTVAGANVTGTVANATFATSAGSANTANSATVANSANSVALANVSGAGNIASINLTGSTSNVLYGNGVFGPVTATLSGDGGNISNIQGANVSGAVGLATNATSANSVALANVSGAGNIASINLTGSTSNVLYGNGIFAPVTATLSGDGGNISNIQGANVSGAVGLATNATSANAVAGANVTGTVANANFASFANIANSANSVAVANVSGIGNIATVNLDGNVSNVLSGNGSFVALPTVSANANYANFAGTAFSVSGSNVSGEVANANFASYSNVANSANAVAGANVTGTVANATFATSAGSANTANSATVAASANSVAVGNVTGIGNIATVNLDGNASNALLGNGVFGPYQANATILTGTILNNGVVTSGLTSVANLTTLQVGSNVANTATTRFRPVGANITALSGNIFVNNTRVSKDDADVLANGINTQDAIINPYDTANASGQSYQLNYLVQDLANTANISIAGSDTFSMSDYGAGNAAAAGDRILTLYTADSELANANPNTTMNYVFGGGGLFLNKQMPNDAIAVGQTGMINMMNYGELSDPASATGISFQRRRGNNSGGTSTRDQVQANDYLGNINWRGAGTATGTVNSGRAVIGAKVGGSYGGPGNVMPIGMEMVVVNSSNAQLTHSFYANGDVSFAGNILSTLPGASSIVNGNSNASFTGAGGDLNITIDNKQYATFFSNRKLQLSGIEADSGNASQLVLDNGGLVLVQEDLGGGFASFDFKSYFSTGFIAPYTFYRARGNISSPNNVQSGDAITTQSYIVYGDSGNTFLNVGTYSATVTANDNAGNVQSRIEIATARNDNGSEVKLNADVVVLEGNSAIDLNANTNMGSGSLFKLANFTASALNAITGSIGQMAAVSDSAGGGNPNGMIAFWDTTNARWSYVHDNGAV